MGRILARGTRRGGIYSIPTDDAKVALFSVRNKTTSEGIWHQRLGHPQSRVTQFLFSKKFINIDEWNKSHSVCGSCQMGKDVNSLLVMSKFLLNRYSKFTMIDGVLLLCCQIKNLHIMECFFDDYVRFTSMYSLKRKSDLFSIFQTFVERRFELKIINFQSDSGGGFSSNEFLHYLENQGIVRQVSYPATPEQNGVSRKKKKT